MANKRRKVNAKPKRRKQSGAAVPRINTRRAFQRAWDAFYDDDDAEKARQLLEQIEDQGSMSDQVMDLYLDVLHAQRDLDHYSRIAITMAERHPRQPNAVMTAAFGAYATAQPVSAILFFERFLELAPEHSGAATAQEELARLRKHLPEILDAFIDHLPKDLPRVASVEKILHFFKLGRFEETIKRCESHLRSYPGDLRVRNNLAEALALFGNDQRALAVLNETLEMAPDNFYAHAARCRVLYFQTRFSESDAEAEILVELQPKQISDVTKAAQAFAYRGDDERIAWAYKQAKSRGWLDEKSTEAALLMHLQATGAARSGDVATARSLWRAADKLAGAATLASANLEDLRRPTGEGSGPFFFDLEDWLDQPQKQEVRELAHISREAEQADDALDSALQRLMTRHPSMEALLPDIIDRSDEGGQTFATMLALRSRNPETREALLAYIQGTRGTDAMRQQLAMSMSRRGELPSSRLSMSVRGKIDQLEFLAFEIMDEPSVPANRSEEVCDLLVDACEALHLGDGNSAEKLFREARKYEPDSPDVLNNLAIALQLQGRAREADQLLDEVIEKYPDYFFGKLTTANRLINGKRYEEALQILVGLHRQKRMHWTEFVGLAKSMVHVHVGKREWASAQRWLAMLQDYDPDHPEIERLKRYINNQRTRQGLLKTLFGRMEKDVGVL